MTTYVIGDVQGCFDELQQLLQLIEFDANKDRLWFVGDLVNRGPKSLEVLRFVQQLKNAIVVLGNHDLHLLSLFHGKDPLLKQHTLHEVLQAPDANKLIDWLRHRPLLHHDEKLGYVMVHAGIYPKWTLKQAKKYAKEVETALCDANYADFLGHMYGNQPDTWQENLTGNERLRFIINSFTRMRFCNMEGKLDFEATGELDTAPEGFKAWFQIEQRKTKDYKIIFGHWAALQGKMNIKNIYALDTGCVWDGSLTAMRLNDEKMFRVPCISHCNIA